MELLVTSCQKTELLSPTTDSRDKIVDTWKCSEKSSLSGQTDHYDSNISKSSSDSTVIYISYFYGLGKDVKAYAKMNSLSISIPKQTIEGNEVSGSGTIASNFNTINLTYTVNDFGGKVDNVTAVYTRIP